MARNLLSLLSFSVLCLVVPAHQAHSQLTNGFTYSRSQGLSTNSSAKSVTLSSSRVLGSSCRAQVQDWYQQQGIPNWADQGCITEPENMIALPQVQGQPDQFEIIDKTRQFGVADKTVSSTSEAMNRQKTVTGFTGFGYSVFVNP